MALPKFKNMVRLVSAVLAGAVGIMAFAGPTAPAYAQGWNVTTGSSAQCKGEGFFCLYYHANVWLSGNNTEWNFNNYASNLGEWKFDLCSGGGSGSCAGWNTYIRNNAASMAAALCTDCTKIITATFAVYNSRRYGISDPVAASRFGYHLPPEPTTANAAADGDQADTSPMTMPPDKRRVFAGALAQQLPPSTAKTPERAVSPGTYHGKTIPVGGCLGQTYRALLDYPAPLLRRRTNWRHN